MRRPLNDATARAFLETIYGPMPRSSVVPGEEVWMARYGLLTQFMAYVGNDSSPRNDSPCSCEHGAVEGFDPAVHGYDPHCNVHGKQAPAAVVAGADTAARELLFLVAIEGISTLSRGGKGCVFRALEALRPDIAEQWAAMAKPLDLLRVYFPEPGEPHHVLIIGKHTGKPIGCMNNPDAEDLRHARCEDPGCTFVPVDPAECICAKEEA